MKKILALLLAGMMTLSFAACQQDAEKTPSETPSESVSAEAAVYPQLADKPAEDTEVAVIETEAGTIKMCFYPEYAPKAVENFLTHAKDGSYDGLTFHRITQDFMIQGGDPKGNGTGGSKENIKGEFSANGVKNPISHKRGVISMARAMDPDSAGSQFFIMHEDAPHLDGQYAAFGKVIDGFEEVERIENVELQEVSPKGMEKAKVKQPVVDEFMVHVGVETFGVEYPKPNIKYWVD